MAFPFKINEKYDLKFLVNKKIYSAFIETFNDKNPLHTQREFAREKGFREEVMHGNILGGFLSYFIGEGLPVKNVVIHSQEIQFKNPVYLNDELFFEASVSEISESVSVVIFGFTFRNLEKKVVAKGKIQIGLI